MISPRARLVLRGISLNYVYLLARLLSTLVLTRVIVTTLGQAGFGVWVIITSFTGYLALMHFGLPIAIAKYTAEYDALNETEKLNRLVTTALLTCALLGVLIIIISGVLIPIVPVLFGVPEELIPSARVAFLLASITVVVTLLSSILGGVIYGYQRVDVWKGAALVQLVVNVVLTILLVEAGFGLIGVGAAALLSNLLLMLLYFAYIRFAQHDIRFHPKLVDFGILKETGPYSLRSFVLGLTAQVLYYTDHIVIGFFLGAFRVAPYAVTYRLTFLATHVFSVISTTLLPTYSHLYSTGDLTQLRKLYLQVTRVSVGIMGILAVVIGLFGSEIIGIWVGAENFAGMTILLIFILMDFTHAVGTPAGILLQAIGKNKGFMYSEIVNAGLNLGLSVVLLQYIGVLGVALGTLVAHLCTSTWVVPYLACKHVGLSVKSLIVEGIAPGVIIGAVVAGAAVVVTPRFSVGADLLDMSVKGFGIAVVYAMAFWVFGSTDAERRVYLGVIRQFVPAAGGGGASAE